MAAGWPLSVVSGIDDPVVDHLHLTWFRPNLTPNPDGRFPDS